MRRTGMRTKSWRTYTGFTLIEVLVTVVILSIGILGVGRLQAFSLQQNQNAAQRTQATLLAYDILDRMRSDRQSAISENYDIDLGETPSGDTLAASTLAQWKGALSDPSLLPGGDGSVDLDPANNLVTINVSWNERLSPKEGDPVPLTVFSLQTVL